MRVEDGQVLEELGVRFGYPKIVGAYLAVNAIPDVWMLIDSPDCGTLRSEMIQDNHDWNSTLISPDGRHRVANTGVGPDAIALDRRQRLASQMLAIGKEEGSYLFVYPAAAVSLIGADYDAVWRTVSDRMRMKVVAVKQVQALGQWVSGYGLMLEELARCIQPPAGWKPGDLDPRKVAVVGYLWDRNEADHAANVAELGRLLAGAGLELATVWLSGKPTADLSRVFGAGTLVELPYAGDAARILAERTGAQVVSTGLPVGLSATRSWLMAVAGAAGSGAQAEAWLASQMPEYYRALAKPVTRWFAHREFLVCTEGHLAAAVAGMLREMGGVVRLVATSGPSPAVDLGGMGIVLHSPDLMQLSKAIHEVSQSASLAPVLVANEQAISILSTIPLAGVFLGFQSPSVHHVYPAPFMGLEGALCLTDKLANSIPLSLCLHR